MSHVRDRETVRSSPSFGRKVQNGLNSIGDMIADGRAWIYIGSAVSVAFYALCIVLFAQKSYYKMSEWVHRIQANHLVPEIAHAMERDGEKGLANWLSTSKEDDATLADAMAMAGQSCVSDGDDNDALTLFEYACRKRERIPDKQLV